MLTEKLRRKMGSLVVDAAKAVQYTNAGTFEFLMDDEGKFYFMEMNTRLQVEHPVTEMVTGIDIVKEQIRIAAGERLVVQAERRHLQRPRHRVPHQRRGSRDVRAVAGRDSRVQRARRPRRPRRHVAHAECTISPYYDSMIAKIIVHGRDRHEAIARMRRALEMTVVEGIKTTVPLHLKILNDPDFLAGRHEHRRSWSASCRSRAARLAGRNRLSRRPLLTARHPRRRRGRGAPAGRRSRWPTRFFDGGATAACSSARSTSPPGRFSSSADAVVALGRPYGAQRDRERPRGRRACWPAPPARTSARTTSRRPTPARSLGPTRSSASRRTTTAQIERGAARAGHLHRDRSGLRHAHEGHRLRRGRPRPRARPRGAARRRVPIVAIGGITLDSAPLGDRRPAPPPSP